MNLTITVGCCGAETWFWALDYGWVSLPQSTQTTGKGANGSQGHGGFAAKRWLYFGTPVSHPASPTQSFIKTIRGGWDSRSPGHLAVFVSMFSKFCEIYISLLSLPPHLVGFHLDWEATQHGPPVPLLLCCKSNMNTEFLVTVVKSQPHVCELAWTSALDSDGARIYTLMTCTMENTMQIGAFGCQT